MPADEHRGEKRAHEMHAIGGGVGGGLARGELADLRAGEAREGARPGALRQHRRAADGRLDRGALGGVLESIQIGAIGRDRSGTICGGSGRDGSSARARGLAPSLRYTLPCCCAEPEIGREPRRSRPLAAIAASSWSRASTHITGEDVGDGRVGAGQHAVPGAVMGKRLVEGERPSSTTRWRRAGRLRAPRRSGSVCCSRGRGRARGLSPAPSGRPRAADRRRADRGARRAAGATPARGGRRPPP